MKYNPNFAISLAVMHVFVTSEEYTSVITQTGIEWAMLFAANELMNRGDDPKVMDIIEEAVNHFKDEGGDEMSSLVLADFIIMAQNSGTTIKPEIVLWAINRGLQESLDPKFNEDIGLVLETFVNRGDIHSE